MKTLREAFASDGQPFYPGDDTWLASPDGIVGREYRCSVECSSVEKVATTDAASSSGETGTGNELIRRADPPTGSRRGAPFVKFHCTAIPVRVSWRVVNCFCHERGAFTGGHRAAIVRFELATMATHCSGRELGDLPLELQPQALARLEEQAFERIVSTQTIMTDVRVAPATTVRLRETVEARESFAPRTSTTMPERVSDRSPALRERAETARYSSATS